MTSRWTECPVPDFVQAESPKLHLFQRNVHDGHLTAMVGPEPIGPHGEWVWHLSLSHRTNTVPPKPGRLPSYAELKEARYTLMPDELQMAQMFPPRAEFVNRHPTTLHLYEVELKHGLR